MTKTFFCGCEDEKWEEVEVPVPWGHIAGECKNFYCLLILRFLSSMYVDFISPL